MKTQTLCILILLALLSTVPALACSAAPPTPDSRRSAQKNIVYGEIDGQKLLLDSYFPQQSGRTALPVVLLVHGGGWSGGDKADFSEMAAFLAQEGYACFNINYRLVEEQANRYPAALDDVQRAVRWVRANANFYGLDAQRIAAIGASAGGHLVALLGTTETRHNDDPALAQYSSRVNAVVDLFGPVDLTRPFSGNVQTLVDAFVGQPAASVPELAREASPVFHIDSQTAPFLIFHGDQDALVPVEQSRQFHQALQAAGIDSTYVEFKNEGHGFAQPASQERFARELLAFFARQLKPAP